MALSLKVANAKKEHLFSQIQGIYELTKKTSDSSILQQLQIRAKSIHRLRQDFSDILDTCEELATKDDPEYKPNYAPLGSVDELVDHINAVVLNIEAKKQAKTKSENITPPPTQLNVRLPKLELKTFTGEPLEWISFKNLFDSSIHDNRTLAAVIKFQYLLSALSGEPFNLVKSLTISEPNYQVAYDLLQARYHAPRTLITLHLNHILDLPMVNHTSKQMRTFVNQFNEHTQALKALKSDITGKNPLFAAMILRKMDNELRRRLETYRSMHKSDSEDSESPLPSIAEIITFLNQECTQIEEASLHSNLQPKPAFSASPRQTTSRPALNSTHSKNTSFSSHKVSLVATSDTPPPLSANTLPQCFVCSSQEHRIYQCPAFKAKDPAARYRLVKDHNRCTSCLGTHSPSDCRSKGTCQTCHNAKHHTLLHFDKSGKTTSSSPKASVPPVASSTQAPVTAPPITSQPSQVSMACAHPASLTPHQTTVLLGTLLIKVTASNGICHVFRGLADTGSQSHFISERAAQLLKAPRQRLPHTVIGLAQNATHSKGLTHLQVETLSGKIISSSQPFLILDKICVDLPRAQLSPQVLDKVRPYTLADPSFHLSGPIDILLGGSLIPLIFNQENYPLGPGLPHVVGTHFGYMVMGEAPCLTTMHLVSSTGSTTLLSINDMELHSSLKRFWTQEEPPAPSKQSAEDEYCETHFLTTHSRDPTGRYVVRLPFKQGHLSLGHSRTNAETRFKALERKFTSQPQFKELYSNFMADYASAGHMELTQNIDLTSAHYFLPHHGVIKESSSTTRLRTVFDASARTSNGVSLNSVLCTGKKLQNNICDMLLRFRLHNFVFSCDIRQMYRQIKIHPSDQQYQLILWRNSPESHLSTYKLTTVTYGINSSPFLALRTLAQLAEDEGDCTPAAAEVLRSQCYIDDLLAGADTEDDALELQSQIITLLGRGGFELRKWTSNSPKLLQELPEGHLEVPVFLQESSQPHYSILGLNWSPSDDTFSYNLCLPQTSSTQRQVLSVIAQIYDPCGFLSPVVMWAKCFMQLLWTKGLAWDQPLPSELLEMWQEFISTSRSLSTVKIPRLLGLSQAYVIDIHGFSDASESGYAAVLYIRCQLHDGSTVVRQVLSKTRVAPLKRLTLPRLELCGAHLLSQLVSHLLSVLDKKVTFNSITLWCDSTVTLTWVQTPPYRLKTFVANRVAEIQSLVPSHCWQHILSVHNPADCASRGILPSDLPNHDLWWHGPEFLQQPKESWPAPRFDLVDIHATNESKPNLLTTLISTSAEEWELLSKFSKFTKLQRVMAYIKRFLHNIKHPDKLTGPLSSAELTAASMNIFKIIQTSVFSSDLAALKKGKPPSTRLRRLSPRLDEEGLLRVGGRLNQASHLPTDAQHPIVLPKRHHVTNLLIDFYHSKYLHSGSQLTQSLLTQHVWILSARSVIRSRIFKCLVCFRHKPRNKMPLMGDLPRPRVTPSRPFLNTGIDYGGPFSLKIHNIRSVRLIKAYICVFVCLVTKAVHIEVVTDLSTPAFIAALTRFTSRRGLCKNIFCDCGTNFVGASNALRMLLLTEGKDKVKDFSANQGITFHFNPPAAPHQGGLWEGAIKSTKHHLRRVIGEHCLTLTEFITLTTQVEAMLNSRPLTPLSNDPADLAALSPGHFLVGSPLAAVPEEDVQHVPDNRLKHWQLVQAFHQRLWHRWHLEYLHTLQQRVKWNSSTPNLQVGDLVLVHQASPPLSWPLARITSVSPGQDGIVRVVHLRTPQGTLTRPAHKVFPLPLNED